MFAKIRKIAFLGLLPTINAGLGDKCAFSIISDWGGDANEPYTKRALHMAESADNIGKDLKTDFLVLLGNNFFENGVRTIEDPRWETTWNKIFDPKFKNIGDLNFYVTAGPADYRNNISAQIEYQDYDKDKRWKYYDLWYKIPKIQYPEFAIDIFMVDTNVMLGKSALDQDGSAEAIASRQIEQYAWLEKELESSMADYLIVAGHDPIFSVSSHQEQVLLDNLLPLLRKYDVQMYLSGHDYNQQVIKDNYVSGRTGDNEEMYFIVSGGSNKNLNCDQSFEEFLPKTASKEFFWCGENTSKSNVAGFAELMADKDSMRLNQIMSDDDKILYTTPEIYFRKKQVYPPTQPDKRVVGYGSSLDITVAGDWGGDEKYATTPRALKLGQSVEAIAQQNDTDFVFLVGDNFYEDGIESVTSARWKTTFQKIFREKYEYSGNLEYYAQTGNHDYKGSVSAQIEYTKVDKRWVMPDLWFSIPDLGNFPDFSISFITIDTDLWKGSSSEDQDPANNEILVESMKNWLKGELQKADNAKADYIIVAGHHPVYTISDHGNSDWLIEELLPLMKEYDVSLYLSGHDHNLQHLTNTYISRRTYLGSTMHFGLSGAANKRDCSKENEYGLPRTASYKLFWCGTEEGDEAGFIAINVDGERLLMEFLTTNDQEVIHSVEIQKRGASIHE